MMDGKLATKEELIKLSENWSEKREIFFRKMLHQGGKFQIEGINYEIILRQIFWAVPALSLVEPAITSSLVLRIILWSAYSRILPLGLLLMAIVSALVFFAFSTTLQVKGVLPLADIKKRT